MSTGHSLQLQQQCLPEYSCQTEVQQVDNYVLEMQQA